MVKLISALRFRWHLYRERCFLDREARRLGYPSASALFDAERRSETILSKLAREILGGVAHIRRTRVEMDEYYTLSRRWPHRHKRRLRFECSVMVTPAYFWHGDKRYAIPTQARSYTFQHPVTVQAPQWGGDLPSPVAPLGERVTFDIPSYGVYWLQDDLEIIKGGRHLRDGIPAIEKWAREVLDKQ